MRRETSKQQLGFLNWLRGQTISGKWQSIIKQSCKSSICYYAFFFSFSRKHNSESESTVESKVVHIKTLLDASVATLQQFWNAPRFYLFIQTIKSMFKILISTHNNLSSTITSNLTGFSVSLPPYWFLLIPTSFLGYLVFLYWLWCDFLSFSVLWPCDVLAACPVCTPLRQLEEALATSWP